MSAVKVSYKSAGVDIDAGDAAAKRIKRLVKQTHNRNVLNELGQFGGFFSGKFTGYRHPVLISSTDSVGTKLKIAFKTGIHNTIGADLVNHCVNDILVHGARPLYFLDYFATSKLKPDVLEQIVSGMATACGENGCALIGGETAELPDFYAKNEYDLAGFVTGVVDKSRIIDGSRIRVGDQLVGLSSSGLHTNGYSLVRKLFFEKLKYKPSKRIAELGCTLGEELLKVHRSYLGVLSKLLKSYRVKGLAHITGGGLPGNLVRILPTGCKAEISMNSWERLPIFNIIEKMGRVETEEMFRVFNMGIGMVVVLAKNDVDRALRLFKRNRQKAMLIGEIKKGRARVLLR